MRSLPPVRHNMMKTQQRHGVLSKVVGFYQGSIMLRILVFGGSLSLFFRDKNSAMALGASLAGGLLTLGAGLSVYSRTDNTAFFEESLEEDSRPNSLWCAPVYPGAHHGLLTLLR